jgi:hypothetical protein
MVTRQKTEQARWPKKAEAQQNHTLMYNDWCICKTIAVQWQEQMDYKINLPEMILLFLKAPNSTKIALFF